MTQPRTPVMLHLTPGRYVLEVLSSGHRAWAISGDEIAQHPESSIHVPGLDDALTLASKRAADHMTEVRDAEAELEFLKPIR